MSPGLVPSCRARLGRLLAAVAVFCLAHAAAAPALAQDARFLAKEDILLYGLGLRVEPAVQTVPKDIATIVSTFLQAPQQPSGLPPFAPDAVVKATLRGPGLAKALELAVQPNSPFNIPPLTVAGVYTLENIRLESQGAVLLRATPESAKITVIDKLLVTEITARPLTAAEIREKGIVFDSSNFQAYNFTAAFALKDGGSTVKINVPVLLPSLQSTSDTEASRATIDAVTMPPPAITSLTTVVPDTLKLATQVPNLTVLGFTLTAPQLQGQNLMVPPIPGVIVIPGDIGFLNQYFSVMLMVGNAAPAGSNLSVANLTADVLLPAGNDRVAGSADDPLRMAMTTTGESPRSQPVVQAGGDGQLGTADDILVIEPGQSGNAEFLVEGRREGSHTIEMSIAGTLLGLPVGPVPITGRAIGAVLVRNPTFTLTFTHPELVVAGEAYTLDVTVTNTSSSPANFVSVNLFGPNVSGATVVGDPTREVETIPPGDSATVTFDLVSRLTGKVWAATLDSDENVSGRFQLKTAVSNDGIPLSPDSLVLPKEANTLPKSLRDAALGLLGKAWAVATAPAGALPKDVQRFSKQIVIDRAIEVAEAGLRVSLHEPLPVSAAQLLMDFAGSNVGRIADLYPPADQDFHLTNFTGFDALRRTSARGDVFAGAVAGLLAADLQANGAAAFHRALGEQWNYRPGFVSVLLAGSGGPAAFDITLIDAQGRAVGGTGPNGKFVKQIPFSEVLAFNDGGGQRLATLLLIAAPEPGTYRLRLTRIAGTSPDAPSTLSILAPAAAAAGDVRQTVFDGITASTAPSYTPADGDPITFTIELAGTDLAPAPTPVAGAASIIPDALPSVVSVVQQAQADTVSCDTESPGWPVGRIVAVLFSEEVAAASVQDRLSADRITAFAPESNRAVGVALQPGRRIAFVAMREPFGPYVPRTMTVAAVEDLRGHAMASWTGPMEATIGDRGAVVSGRIIQGDGTPVAGAEVRLFAIVPCGVGGDLSKIGISSKLADDQGRYSWDFVNSDLRAAITAIEPGTEDFRSIPFDISRPGQRLNVDVVLLGRGTFSGRVLAPDGRTPLAESQVRVTSLTDHSQFGATTDETGAFAIGRIPVGNIFVEAVNVDARAHFNFSEYLPFAGAIVTRDIVLVAADARPASVQVKYSTLSGHVLRSDGATPSPGAPVVAYYQHASQPNVYCPPSTGGGYPPECAVGVATSAADGSFSLAELPAGDYRLYAFDQPSLAQGEVRFLLPEGAGRATILLSGGLATVRGIVVDSTGARVPGARVGGGLSLGVADANGAFVLTDVPVGRRTIVAVSDALGVKGSAEVDIVASGEVVNVTIVLPTSGAIAGVVTRADGTTPAAGVPVYAIQPASGGGVLIAGQAVTDASGAYRIDQLLAGEYQVSAFTGDFSDGNIVPAVLRYERQVLRADIRFRGAGGRVAGTVYDSDGNTPLAARVGLSGVRVRIAGGRVGIGFQPVANYAIVDTGFDGKFAFNGLFVGEFTLRAVGAFSPDPIESTNRIAAPNESVTVDLRLQATSQVAGIVYQPDGVTPAANVNVAFKSDASRTICSEGLEGPVCESIPQGVQAEYAVSDAQGHFLIPLVNAGAFTLSFEDPLTGKVAQVRATVRPGERAEIPARLLGRGTLTVRVLSSDGRTPIPGARVEVAQPTFPRASLSMTADAQGVLVLGGGDALSEGEVTILVRDVRNGFTGRASAVIARDGEEVSVNAYIYDAWGTVSGTVFKADGITRVPNAEVVVSVGGKALGYTVADANGQYSQDTVPIGPFSVDVFEAATSRIGYASGRIDLDKQGVVVNVTQVPIGLVTGTAIDATLMTPLAGWTVSLSPRLESGRSMPSLRGMTAGDGRFSFPGVAKGTFTLGVSKANVAGSASAEGELYVEGQVVDVPLLVTMVHPLYGRIEGTVRNPDGTPAAFAAVEIPYGPNTVAAADGTFSFPPLTLGRYQVTARAQASANAGSVWADLAVNGDLVNVTIAMVGLTAVHGQVVHANNSPAAGVRVMFDGQPASGCGLGGCAKFTDANGEFSFTQLPARSFTLSAEDPVSGLKGAVGGPLNPGEDKALRVVLQPSALVQGRVLKAGGAPASGITSELTVGPDHLFLGTDAEGRFSYPAVPLVPYTLQLSDPIGEGSARRSGALTGDLNLGDIILDEAPPQVVSLTPAASAARVPLGQVFTVVFSEPIDPAGVTPAGIALSGPAGAVTVLQTLGAGDTTVTLTPLSPLDDESRYTLRITGIKDRLGKVMADYTASFTTVDITPPAFLDLSPAQGASGVPIYSTIRIKFSEPIDPAGFASSPLSLTLGEAAVGGRFDYLFGNTVVAFTPALPLVDGASYRVRLPAARDLAGNVQAQALDFAFSTTDRTPPQIVALEALSGPAVIEGTTARVRPQFSAASDVGVVDFYLNGVAAGSSRTAPFAFAFQATPSLGAPGSAISVTAIATDTSGNRGPLSSPLAITVTPDTPPAVVITAPAAGTAFRNGARVTVTLQATDDVGLVTLGYKAFTGKPQDAATIQLSPPVLERTATFGFDVPADAAPGAAIQIQASAVDAKGQTTPAAPVSFTVLDAVAPAVTISGGATGDRVKPGQTVTVTLNASDLGGLTQLTFAASGSASLTSTRPIEGGATSVVTSFTFTVSPTARTGDTVALDGTATDLAGNTAAAARVLLTVGDITPPSVTLRTLDGSTTVLPGQTFTVVAQASDDQAVVKVDLGGQGAFTLSDSRQVSPPSNSATLQFPVIVPGSAPAGSQVTLSARATDVAGNVSGPATVVLTIGSSITVTMPPSIVMLAGETKSVVVTLAAPAQAGGQVITFDTAQPTLAAAPGSITIPEGQTEGAVTVTALAGGTTALRAYIQGSLRASTTLAIQGGVVSGVVYDDLLNPIAGAEVTIGTNLTATTDQDGFYRVTGVSGVVAVVKAVDPVTRKRGSLTVMLSGVSGYAKNANVVLIAAGGVAGTVFAADGTTPAGEGVQIDIYAQSSPGQSLGTTFTGADSRYEFPVVTQGAYLVDARAIDGRRGRANAAVTAGEDTAVNVTFLGKGTITGVVRDGGSVPVPNAQVVLSSSSVFGNGTPTTIAAGPDGVFSFPSVFVGSFWIRATDARNGQAGVASGQIGQDQETVSIDVYVASYGFVRGTVYRSDGTTTAANANVSLRAGPTYLAAATDTAGSYEFPVVPLGTASITVSEPSTRGVGKATATLTANAESVTANVTLEPQGTLVVTVTDALGAPAVGAGLIVASSRNGFGDSQAALTGADGRAVVSRVLAGPFTVIASKSGLGGVATGTLGADQTLEVTIALEPLASIAGTAWQPNGESPAAGVVRLYVPGGWRGGIALQQVPIAADGTYRFDNVKVGTYQVLAIDAQGRSRALSSVVSLTAQGQVATANLTFVGLGTVTGRVLNIDASSAANVVVQLRSLHPIFGGYRSMRTNAAGYYTTADVPVGAVTVLAGSVEQGLFAEAAGTLGADGGTLTLDLLLKNNSTYFPVWLHDANAMPFDIVADGTVANGAQRAYQHVFRSADGGGLKLEIETGGATTAFTGATVGTLETGERQVVARQQGLAGLDITRRVYVPADGYFARYVDLLTNPGSEPVIVNVWLSSHVDASTLVSTSSGDAALGVADAGAADRWLVIDDSADDNTSLPPLALVFDGPGAARRVALAGFAPSNSVVWRWDSVTVPAGGSVAFLHFAVQQSSRAAAQASAERLVQLPPEALEYLPLEAVSAIQNFAVPADGLSELAALPARTGTVTGLAAEADGTTPVPYATVRFTSESPYFTRTHQTSADAVGFFRFEARLDGSSSAIPIPVEPFSLAATYPGTGVPSPAVPGSFGAGQVVATQNIVFSTTAGIRGSVRRSDGTVVGPGTVAAAGTWNASPFSRSASIAADGSFAFTGLPPVALTLTASVPHPQGSAATGTASVTLASGVISDVLITLPAAGAVQGTVRTGGGLAAASRTVTLKGGAFTRSATTDTAGAFLLTAVPAGSYALSATEPASGLTTTAAVTVVGDQTVTQDLQLVSVGIVRGTVKNASNAIVAGVPVDLVSGVAGLGTLRMTTNTSGAYQFTGVPVGTFLVSATSSALSQYGEVAGAVESDGQQVVADVTMASNIVTLPRTRFDANSLSYDIQQNGRVRYGYNSVFRGPSTAGAAEPYGASMLSLVAGGTETAFAGAATAIGEVGNREWAIRQLGLAGLDVTRKVYVPETGYFARYLEVLSNPGAAPVTVDVKVNSTLGYANYDYWWGWFKYVPSLKGSSSGDATLDVTGASPDRWVVFDDTAETDVFGVNQPSTNLPAAAFVFDGAGGAARVASAAITQPLTGNLLYQWNSVTIPAGGKVILMHFVVQQSSKAAGLASAERLVQLPPEAVAGINDDERALIANFAVPADGSSALAELPALTGAVTGRVLEKDGAIVPNSTVKFVSSVPYFSRLRMVASNASGAFTLQSAFSGSSSTAIPVADFTLTALHRVSSIESPAAAGSFDENATTASLDIVFTNTASITGALRRHTGAIVPNASVYAAQGNTNYGASTGTTGTYAFRGLAAGTWTLQSALPTNGWLVATASAATTLGQTTTQDLVFPPTGRVVGQVFTATGEPAQNLNVMLERADGSVRYGYQYTEGFEFPDTPLGNYKLYVTDGRTGARTQFTVTVNQDLDTVQNLTLPAAGSLQVQVNFARGAAAAGARVEVKDAGTSGTFSRTTYADAAGRATIDNVAAGPVTVRAYHPTDQSFFGDANTTLAAEGSIVPVTVTLPGLSTVNARAVVSTGATVAGVYTYVLNQAGATLRTATTDAAGLANLGLVANGASYTIKGERYVGSYNSYYVTTQSPAFSPAGDGDTNTIDVTVPAVANVTVALVKPDGTSFGRARLWVQNAFRTNFEDQGATSSTTGLATLAMPEGAYTIRVKDSNTGASLLDFAGSIAPASEGQAVTVTITVGAVSGTLTGQVFGADGTTPIPSARVRLINAMDQLQMTSTTASSTDGRYTFSNVRAGTGGFIVRALPPSSANDQTQTDAAGSFTTAGETLTVNVTIPFARMTVGGTVFASDGVTPIGSGRKVEIVSLAGTVLASTTTNATSAYGPLSVLGSTDGVKVRAYDPSATIYGEQLQLPGPSGGTFTVNVNVPVIATTLQGTVTAADGATGVQYASLTLRNAAGAAVATFSTNQGGAFSAIVFAPAGDATLAASYAGGIVADRTAVTVPLNFASAGPVVNVNVTLPLSVVRGHARYADRPDGVLLSWAQAVGRDSQTRNYMSRDTVGNFVILGTPVGPFRVYATETSAPGGTGAATAAVTDISVPVDVDVVLPAPATLYGKLLDAAGQPALENLGVSLAYNVNSTRAYANQAGYTLAVPAGPVSVQACQGNDWVCATLSGTAPAGGAVELNLGPPPTGTLVVRALRPGGTAPYAGKWMRAESRSGSGPQGYWEQGATTDTEGRITLTGVPAGVVFVEMWDSNTAPGIAAPVTVVAGKTNVIDLVGGSGVYQPALVSGGVTFNPSTAGYLNSGSIGSLGSPYNGSSYYLYVNDRFYYPDADMAAVTAGGTQVDTAPDDANSLIMSRKVAAPGNKGYIRYLETVHNPTGVPLPVSVRIYPNLRDTTVVTGPGTTGSRYVITGPTAGFARAAVASVIAGAGETRVLGGVTLVGTTFEYVWATEIQPGATVSFLHFTVPGDPADVAGLQARAQALVDLSDADALAGLTGEETSRILNFIVPGAKPAVTGSISGVVVAPDGTTPFAGATVKVMDAFTGYVRGTAVADAAGAFRFDDVPNGDHGVAVVASLADQPGAAAGEAVTFNAPGQVVSGLVIRLDLPLVSGRVTSAGVGVPNPVVLFSQVDAAGAVTTRRALTWDADGRYAVVGIKPGTFTLAVTDAGGTVGTTAEGIYDGTNTVSLDIALPAGAVCVAPLAGLRGFWRADGDLVDSVSPGSDAENWGTVSFGPARVGDGFDLDGETGLVAVPDTAGALRPAALTVSAWVKFNSLDSAAALGTGQQVVVFKKKGSIGPDGRVEGYAITKARAVDGTDRFVFTLVRPDEADIQGPQASQTAVEAGRFYHVVATADGTVGRLYIDGMLEATFPFAFPVDAGTEPLFFGGNDQPDFDPRCDCVIDEVQVYDRALGPAEIQAMFAATTAGTCPELRVLPAALPPSYLEQPSTDSIRAVNGFPPVTFTSSGPPPGLTLASDGRLTGVPTTLGSFTFDVSVTDGRESSIEYFTKEIRACLALPDGAVSLFSGESNAVDSFGLNDGVASGVSFMTGKSGRAFEFADAYDRVDSLTPPLDLADTFTIEFWARPTATRGNTVQSTSGVTGTSGEQRYAITPEIRAEGAGAGVSVGTNGVSVFEHGAGYMPSLLVYNLGEASFNDWTHIAVVYENKKPSLYVNGTLVLNGLTSLQPHVYAPKSFGDPYGYGPYYGGLDEVALYGRALTGDEIYQIYTAGSMPRCKTVAR